jgi:hypothetical protein
MWLGLKAEARIGSKPWPSSCRRLLGVGGGVNTSAAAAEMVILLDGWRRRILIELGNSRKGKTLRGLDWSLVDGSDWPMRLLGGPSSSEDPAFRSSASASFDPVPLRIPDPAYLPEPQINAVCSFYSKMWSTNRYHKNSWTAILFAGNANARRCI